MKYTTIALIVCLAGCGAHAPQAELSVEQMWMNKGGDSQPRGDINDFDLPWQRMRDVLNDLPPDRFDREYERLVQSPLMVPEKYTEFSYLYLESVISILEARQDEARMVRLLASHCPASNFDPIEWDLAWNFRNPVRILDQSYQTAKTPEARKNLEIVFRRIFPDVSRGLDGDDLVHACVGWYASQKGMLVLDIYYPAQYGIQHTSNRQRQDDLPEDDALPMYILKSKESPEHKSIRETVERQVNSPAFPEN